MKRASFASPFAAVVLWPSRARWLPLRPPLHNRGDRPARPATARRSYRAAAEVFHGHYGPSGSENAVIRPGDPPLTQWTMEECQSYLENVLELRTSAGELRLEERQALATYMREHWDRMSRADRLRLLISIEEWEHSIMTMASAAQGAWSNGEQARILQDLPFDRTASAGAVQALYERSGLWRSRRQVDFATQMRAAQLRQLTFGAINSAATQVTFPHTSR